MPQPIAVDVITASAVSDGGTVETAILVTSPVNTITDDDEVVIIVSADWTIGTGGTALELAIRKGDGTGGDAVVTGEPLTVTAGDKVHAGIIGTDRPGNVVGMVYTVTAKGTGNSADGTADIVAAVTITSSAAG